MSPDQSWCCSPPAPCPEQSQCPLWRRNHCCSVRMVPSRQPLLLCPLPRVGTPLTPDPQALATGARPPALSRAVRLSHVHGSSSGRQAICYGLSLGLGRRGRDGRRILAEKPTPRPVRGFVSRGGVGHAPRTARETLPEPNRPVCLGSVKHRTLAHRNAARGRSRRIPPQRKQMDALCGVLTQRPTGTRSHAVPLAGRGVVALAFGVRATRARVARATMRWWTSCWARGSRLTVEGIGGSVGLS